MVIPLLANQDLTPMLILISCILIKGVCVKLLCIDFCNPDCNIYIYMAWNVEGY